MSQWAQRLTCFLDGSPFPEGLSPDAPAADYASDPRAQTTAAAAPRVVELRD